MKAKVKWLLILVVSLAMTAVTLLFLQKYLSEETERRLQQAEPASQSVVVFVRSVAANEQLSAEQLALREFPQHLVSSHWLLADEVGGLLGQRLRYSVQQGEPLTRAMLLNDRQVGLSQRVPDGHYAVTLAAQDEARHNGLLAVGDKVDVVFYSHLMGGERVQHSFVGLTVFDTGKQMSASLLPGITLLVPASQIRQFTRARTDNYSLWVRAASLKVATQDWAPLPPSTKILSWSGAPQ